MEIDPPPPSRKRPISSLTSTNHNNSDGDDNDDISTTTTSPSKRLQAFQGLPIPQTQPHHLNTHLLLNSLALTRLRVTANYNLYNPYTSPVLISIIRSDDTLYRTLCSVLPFLYPLSPTLQSLCVMPAEQDSFGSWTQFQRLVPICTTADLDEEAADEVRTFLEDVASTPDVIVLFDAKGRGVWSSGELPRTGPRTEASDAVVLRMHLCRALRQMMPREEDGEAMELE